MRWLAAGLVALGAMIIALQWLWPPSEPEVRLRPSRTEARELDIAAYLNRKEPPLPELEAFAEVWERPLFRDDRRPAPPDEEGAAEPAPAEPVSVTPPRVTLSGVVIVDNLRTALLKEFNTQRTMRRKEGDSVDGWVLEQVNDDKVILVQDGNREELVLRQFNVPNGAPEAPKKSSGKAEAEEDSKKTSRRGRFSPRRWARPQNN